jgi:hypothetical protein
MSIKLKPQIEDFLIAEAQDISSTIETFVYRPNITRGFDRIIIEDLIRRKIKNQIGLLGKNPSRIKNVVLDSIDDDDNIPFYRFDVVYPNEFYVFALNIISNTEIEDSEYWKVRYFVVFIGKYMYH